MTLTEISASTWRVESLIGNRNLYQYLVVDQGQALIIDAGMASTARDAIIPAVRSLGLPSAAVTAILVTHCDLDHQGGLAILKAAFPRALATCGFHDRAIVREPERLLTDRYGAFEHEHGVGFTDEEKAWMRSEYGDPVELDLTWAGGEQLEVAERRLRVLHAPRTFARPHDPARARPRPPVQRRRDSLADVSRDRRRRRAAPDL